ncbi:MAG: hypothetical protein AAFX00_04260, partial [Pseudomonadota bacterium]
LIQDPRPDTEALVHWNLVEAVGEEDPQKLFRIGGISDPAIGRNNFLWNHEMRPRPDGWGELWADDDLDANVAPMTWTCMEWMFDSDTETSRMFWDGEERPRLHVIAEAQDTRFDMPPVHNLKIGWTVYQTLDIPYVVWIDEVAVDHDRIGCDP